MKIGILGAGQLGRMLGDAARSQGFGVTFLDPATEVSVRPREERLVAAYEDVDVLTLFRVGLDRVTYEFENIPVESLQWLADRLPVHPAPSILRLAQDRLFEKDFFAACGIATPPYADVHSLESLRAAVERIGLPAVIKTRRFGYDGKGQRVLRTAADVTAAWEALSGFPLILEGFVPFECEISALAARAEDGTIAVYDPVRNIHSEGILRLSIAPAPGISNAVRQQAIDAVTTLAEKLNYVGLLAVEFFVVSGRIMVNEMAPRVHNSGHWTIEGAATSQFVNHLRCVAGMAPCPATTLMPSAMINLLGRIPPRAASIEGATLHDYEKRPRAGRKVGHLTLTDADPDRLLSRVREAWRALALPEIDLL